jgi:hypothetical protein
MPLTKEEKQAHVGKFASTRRYGLAGSSDRDADAAHQELTTTCARTSTTITPPRPAQAGRAPPRFLNYLQRKDLEGYRALIKELGLRR